MNELTHINQKGEAHMVDISDKAKTKRSAIAQGLITMKPETLDLIIKGEHKKGDVLATARIAGIMAAKKTPELIPLCHNIPLTKISINIDILEEKQRIAIQAIVETVNETGVEIEALLAVEVALLTIYDMCKAVDRGMVIGDIKLMHKSGGQSGTWEYV